MGNERTTVAVQRYLDELAGDSASEPVIRALLDRSLRRLGQLCSLMLHRSYPRLTRPPLNLQTDEMLSAVVARLMKALREARPGNVRQFFGLASQHMRWELNEMARRLDEEPAVLELRDDLVPPPGSTSSPITPRARRILDAIERLPAEEREAFDLVRIQGLSLAEAGRVLGVSPPTVMRRVNRSLDSLASTLADLRPNVDNPGT